MWKSKKIIILAEKGNEVLIKIEDSVSVDKKQYKTTRYEWWSNREKMKQGIYGEGNYIYCRGFAGSTDEDVIKIFNH